MLGFRLIVMSIALTGFDVDASAAESGRGIAVAGTGESKGKPSIVELSGTVTGEAELASDAITKYRDNRQRAVEAMDNLKIEGLKVKGSGVSISSALSPQAMQHASSCAHTSRRRRLQSRSCAAGSRRTG